jgi:hypothetical protein
MADVVSRPDISPISFECPMASAAALLTQLRNAGYEIVNTGTAERLMRVTEMVTLPGTSSKVARQHITPTMVEAFPFDLPNL